MHSLVSAPKYWRFARASRTKAVTNPSRKAIYHFISSFCFSRSVLTGLVWGALLGSLFAFEAPTLTCELQQEDGIYQSTDGVVDLKWHTDGAEAYELTQQSSAQRIKYGLSEVRYHGPDASSVRTGLNEGWHLFKVRAIAEDGSISEWSEPLELKVTYMNAGRLRVLLILGGIVVLSTAGAIVHGHLSHRKRKEAEA